MELSFSELRAKEVVNTQDGRKLGRVSDIVLCYPENKWIGIVVPGSRGWARKKNELFIELKNIVKIGEDVILVNVGVPRPPKGNKRDRCATKPNDGDCFGGYSQNERNYEEYE